MASPMRMAAPGAQARLARSSSIVSAVNSIGDMKFASSEESVGQGQGLVALPTDHAPIGLNLDLHDLAVLGARKRLEAQAAAGAKR